MGCPLTCTVMLSKGFFNVSGTGTYILNVVSASECQWEDPSAKGQL